MIQSVTNTGLLALDVTKSFGAALYINKNKALHWVNNGNETVTLKSSCY